MRPKFVPVSAARARLAVLQLEKKSKSMRVVKRTGRENVCAAQAHVRAHKGLVHGRPARAALAARRRAGVAAFGARALLGRRVVLTEHSQVRRSISRV
ncbi:hypothetical protein EVAR_75720_1 [Eumeta japonica]|uniref:Uncharacterized protein n=1 Tax=Eumeta variegata TaxID=151549 RepID=A0A4C1W1A4_EUMVA|nr:hypothetical protein EVAR_75720_1 [Eumeta japonica]